MMLQEFDLLETLENLAGDDVRASGLGMNPWTPAAVTVLIGALVRDN